MFIVELTYCVPTSEIDANMHDHIVFLEKYFQNGTFFASGRKEPRDGGIILARAASKKELEKILEEDPFKSLGLAEYRIIEFRATKKTKAFDALDSDLED